MEEIWIVNEFFNIPQRYTFVYKLNEYYSIYVNSDYELKRIHYGDIDAPATRIFSSRANALNWLIERLNRKIKRYEKMREDLSTPNGDK